jgi:hypothetical protein
MDDQMGTEKDEKNPLPIVGSPREDSEQGTWTFSEVIEAAMLLAYHEYGNRRKIGSALLDQIESYAAEFFKRGERSALDRYEVQLKEMTTKIINQRQTIQRHMLQELALQNQERQIEELKHTISTLQQTIDSNGSPARPLSAGHTPLASIDVSGHEITEGQLRVMTPPRDAAYGRALAPELPPLKCENGKHTFIDDVIVDAPAPAPGQSVIHKNCRYFDKDGNSIGLLISDGQMLPGDIDEPIPPVEAMQVSFPMPPGRPVKDSPQA